MFPRSIHCCYTRCNKKRTSIGCEAVQFRFFSSVSPSIIDELFRSIEGFFYYSELLIKYDDHILEKIRNYYPKYSSFQNITFFNAPYAATKEILNGNILSLNEAFVIENIEDSSCCGKISKAYFSPSLDLYMETLFHNNCLNRKIGIDVNGNIKNCPSSIKSYGNVGQTQLLSAISDEFKEMWKINKSQIDVCNVCEYRMICTDCRVFLKDSANIYSKPSKCSYNPYTATWE